MSGEQAVQSFPVVDVCSSIKEDPVVRPEQFVSDIDNTRSSECRGVEHFSRHVARGCDDDESSVCLVSRTRTRQDVMGLLVKNRDTAERSTVPFGMIFLKLGIYGFEEWPHEGQLEGISSE